MGGVQRVRHLRADVRDQRFGDEEALPPAQAQNAAQRHSVHELQHEDRAVLLGLLVVERGDDAGMVQRAHHPSLVRQHRGDPGIAPALRRQDLQHHPPAERPCAFELGEPDFAHAPEPQTLLEDVPAADAFAGLHYGSLTHPFRYLLYRTAAGQ